MNRALEPGWIMLACPDGRRGTWIRVDGNRIELCGGREGDDEYVAFNVGETIRPEHVKQAQELVAALEWSREIVATECTRIKHELQPSIRYATHTLRAEVISAPSEPQCIRCGRKGPRVLFDDPCDGTST